MSQRIDRDNNSATVGVRFPAPMLAVIDAEAACLRGLVPGAAFGRSEAVRALIARAAQIADTPPPSMPDVEAPATVAARPSAPVAAPLTWQEIARKKLREAAVANGGAVALNVVDAERVVGRGVAPSRRALVAVFARAVRNGPLGGLGVEPMGRDAGDAYCMYRLTAVDG